MTTFMDMHYYNIVGNNVYYVAHDNSYSSQLKNGLTLDELCMAEYMSPFPCPTELTQPISLEDKIESNTCQQHTSFREYSEMDILETKVKSQKNRNAIKTKRIHSNRRKSDYVKKSKTIKNMCDIIEEDAEYITEMFETKHDVYKLPFYSDKLEFMLCHVDECNSPEDFIQIFKHITKKLIVIITSGSSYYINKYRWDAEPLNWDELYPGYETIYIEKYNKYECTSCDYVRDMCGSCKWYECCKRYGKSADAVYTKEQLSMYDINKLKDKNALDATEKTILEMKTYMHVQKYQKYNENYYVGKFNYSYQEYSIDSENSYEY